MDATLTQKLRAKTTPMMEQWERCKKQAKKALLLFRMGDFYEAFYEDAETMAEALNLTLTKRQGIPMSGVPHHTCSTYIDRLVNKGFCVAVAEQVEDPRFAKGLVKREVIKILTPSTNVDSTLVSEKSNNFLASITQIGAIFGIALCDISTGEFKTCECESEKELLNELFLHCPSEIVTTEKFREKHHALFEELHLSFDPLISLQEAWTFEHKMANGTLTEHFNIRHLDGFGLKAMVAAINACGGLLAYLKDELTLPITHIRKILPYTSKACLVIDRTSLKHLELLEPLLAERNSPTLLSVIDKTRTPMGGRLLRNWLKAPLLSTAKIAKRQDATAALLDAPKACLELSQSLKQVRDLERLMMKIEAGYANPRDLGALRQSIGQIAPLKEIAMQVGSAVIAECLNHFADVSSLEVLLEKALEDELPAKVSDGHVFRSGYLPKLDELKGIAKGGKAWIASYQAKIKEKTGIKTLRISYNRIFGYYIEVSKGQAHLVPNTFERRQTLVNAERFISSELKEYESKVLTAEEEIQKIESEAFAYLRREVAKYAEPILKIAKAISVLDVFTSFAKVAREYRFCRPVVDEGHQIEIIDGRHPVVERALDSGEFISNDTHLNGEDERLMLITGPNMAGKSTYIRQVALIVILAQMGSFVPAKKAHLGVCDKVFSRIGASDDLASRQSTFMVEMNETANILNNATSRSLVVLDEIGRGTSTYDGVAIAWAVAEYLLKEQGKQAKTLFATHYFELTALEQQIPGAVNYNVAVKEWNDTILFCHKIVKGYADRSYGIYVAKLAGLPFTVLKKASEILKELEKTKQGPSTFKPSKKERQLSLFPEKETNSHPLQQEILSLDLEKITPLEALNKLSMLQNKIHNGL